MNSFPATSLRTFNVLKKFSATFLHLRNAYPAYFAMHYAVCMLVNVPYIVICNTVLLIVGKVTLQEVISMALCAF